MQNIYVMVANEHYNNEVKNKVLAETGHTRTRLTLIHLVKVVCDYFGIYAEDLKDNSRKSSNTFPKQIFCYLAKTFKQEHGQLDKVTTLYVNYPNRCMVTHNYKLICDLIKVDQKVKKVTQLLETRVEQLINS